MLCRRLFSGGVSAMQSHQTPPSMIAYGTALSTSICLNGNLDVHAMETMLLTRLALLPKPGSDFRPLGIGGAITDSSKSR